MEAILTVLMVWSALRPPMTSAMWYGGHAEVPSVFTCYRCRVPHPTMRAKVECVCGREEWCCLSTPPHDTKRTGE